MGCVVSLRQLNAANREAQGVRPLLPEPPTSESTSSALAQAIIGPALSSPTYTIDDNEYFASVARVPFQVEQGRVRLKDVVLLHQIVRTLLRGIDSETSTVDAVSNGGRRPALPLELVDHIFSFLDIALPDTARSKHVTSELIVSARGWRVGSSLWFSAGSWERETLLRFQGLHLITYSRDQGWASYPERKSHSWFDIGITTSLTQKMKFKTAEEEDDSDPEGYAEASNLNPTYHIKTRDDGSPLVWRSHHNRIAEQECQLRETDRAKFDFGPDHEIWIYLEPKVDRISVFGAAQEPLWKCHGKEGSLLLLKKFKVEE